MHQDIYEQLKVVTRSQSTTHPQSHRAACDPRDGDSRPPNTLASILGKISSYEDQRGRPILSMVVLLEESNMPGKGFSELGRELGLDVGQDDVARFGKEQSRICASWK